MSRLFHASVACAALVLTIAGGCSRPEPKPRILFVGVDGMEWSVIAPMVRNGELPNLRSLMERGVFGKLETMEPTMSPVIWTTIATGKTPEEHGIHHFYLVDPQSGEKRLYNRTDRKARAFWNILTDYERRSHVVGWFMTHPAEPIQGLMVSQYTSLDRAKELWKGTLEADVPNQTYPESFYEELRPDIEAAAAESPGLERRIFMGDVTGDPRDLELRLAEHTLWAIESDALYARIAEKILRTDPDFDIAAVYFGSPDVGGHRFWRYYRPEEFRFPPARGRIDRFGNVIPEIYRVVDEWIGRLVSLCGEGVTVFVVSDHGMDAINQNTYFEGLQRVQQMNSAHHLDAARSPGILVAAGPGIASRDHGDLAHLDPAALPRVGSVLEIAPTLLYLLGIPVGRDMSGDLLDSVLDPSFRDDHELLEVDTHERPEADPDAEVMDEEMEREMLKRFKDLGYIGGND